MDASQIEFLQNVPVFGGLTAETLEFLLDNDPIVNVSKGEFFFRENDKAKSFFVLTDGTVSILKSWKEHEYHLRHLHKGDLIGEMALIDFCSRSASVLAVEDCTALEITTLKLSQFHKIDLEQYALLYMNMGREVSRRLREADSRIFQSRMEAKAVGEEYSPRSV